MVKLINWKDRLAWAAALRLPDDRLTFFLMLLIKEADREGILPLLTRKLHQETGIDPGDMLSAVDRLVMLGLLKRDGIDDRFDEPRYELMHGAKPDAVQLTLGIHAMISAIEKLEHITDRQQLALEKLVIRHYDWLTGMVTATTAQIYNLSPRWSGRKTREVIEELLAMGHLTRAELRGYRRRPHTYRLEIRTNAVETRQIPEPLSAETRQISEPLSAETRQISEPLSAETRQKSATHPYTLDSPETLSKTPPPSPPGGGGSKRSNFLERLIELNEDLAFHLSGLVNLESECAVRWHESWADRAVEEIEQVIEQGGFDDPVAVLIVRWRVRLKVWDFSRPAPPQIDRQPRGMAGRY